jgi:hypothetical protein
MAKKQGTGCITSYLLKYSTKYTDWTTELARASGKLDMAATEAAFKKEKRTSVFSRVLNPRTYAVFFYDCIFSPYITGARRQ